MDVDMERLMPRTKAATDRAAVNVGNLREYMATSKFDAVSSVGARSGVVVRGDVRKDDEGFEDIDEFWADDDAGDRDDDEDDDESFEIENQTATDTSLVSSGMQTSSDDDDSRRRTLGGRSSRGSRNSRNSRTSRSSRGSTADALEVGRQSSGRSSSSGAGRRSSGRQSSIGAGRKSGGRALSIEVGRQSTGRSSSPPPEFPMDDDAPESPRSFDFGDASPLRSPEENITMRSRRQKSRGSDEFGDERKSKSIGRGRSYGEDEGQSPFSVEEGALTPLSDASDRNLKSIKPFSDRYSINSPDISTDLFASKKRNIVDKVGRGAKSKSKKAKATKVKKTGTSKSTSKRGNKSDVSFQTDGDESFHITDDDADATGDDSFYDEKSTVVERRARKNDLSFAADILRDAGIDDDEDDEDDNPNGLRRSKRKRYAPLAWYKGEHFVYERKHIGVGLVLPTVVGVERAGASSPTKRQRKRTAKRPSQRSMVKALSPSELPDGLKFDPGEWAELYDAAAGCINAMNVICRTKEIRLRKLPSVEDGVPQAFAGQSFNLRTSEGFPQWICGRLVLPPGAAKDPESVGGAVQIFYVSGGQPGALEVAFGPPADEDAKEDEDDFFASSKTTRFLLSPGDEFYVPTGNTYFVKNHSRKMDCDLRFTILKPAVPAAAGNADEENKEAAADEKRTAD